MFPKLSLRDSAAAFLAYGLTAVVFHWPLPLRPTSAFTGPVAGDTGVYIWNLWVFRHEIVAHARFPLFTNEILTMSPPVDLSLHNYTLFANMLAFPLIPRLGVAASFNLVYLALATTTAWTMFLLARRIVGRTPEAWLAGLLFGFSPILVARSTAHFSLTEAAPLPIFILCLMRAERESSVKNAAAIGATMAWATICDPYFGVYCLLIGACYLAARRGRLCVHRHGPVVYPRILRVIDAFIVGVAGIIVLIVATGATELQLLGLKIKLTPLYTPVLVLTVLAAAHLWLRLRPTFVPRDPLLPASTVRCLTIAAASCLLLLSPLLYALGARLSDGGALHQPIFWRSGPRGVDLLAFFTPNPNNKLFGLPWRTWLTTQYGGYAENVAALTLGGLFVIGVAIWKYRFHPPRVWLFLTVVFGALALGPFVHIGGVNTLVPGPWALLRYVPIISATRMPARFAIVLMMAFSVIFALALAHIADRLPRHRRPVLLGAVGLMLAVELSPLPRRVPAAPIPDIYQIIADDPRDVSVLGIPFGFSDGEGGEGRYNGASQFYQTFHQKRIVGGAMSRISENERRRQRRPPVRRALLRLSEGAPITQREFEAAKRAAPGFVRRARLGYVVIDTPATSVELREFVIEIFGLVKIAESDGRELYRPTVGRAVESGDPADR